MALKADERVQLFKTIFEQTPVSTQIFTPDGETLLVNKAWELLWNIKFNQLQSYNILKDQQLIDTGVMPYVMRGFAGEVVDLPTIQYDPSLTIDLPNTTVRWLSARMYPITDNGQITHIVLQHEDITEQKEFEEKVRASEERLRIALDAGQIGVWDWDIRNDLLKWTDNVYVIHDVSKENFELNFKNFGELIYPEDRSRVRASLNASLESKEPFQMEFRIITGSGRTKWITTSAVVLTDAENNGIRMLGATSDITEQKLIEQEKSDFLSMTAHELRTPLTSMKIFIELLRKELDPKLQSKAYTYTLRVKEQTARLAELTNDLLDVSRIETGKLKLNREQFNLTDLIRESVEGLQATAMHQFEIEGDVELSVFADKYRIYQILVNLIDNAIKYSSQDKKIIVSLTPSENEVIVAVKDFGIGIEQNKIERVFERLYQVNDPTAKTYPGLGLGLYIAKEIVLRHNGRIWVESEKGKGSIFYFSLPR